MSATVLMRPKIPRSETVRASKHSASSLCNRAYGPVAPNFNTAFRRGLIEVTVSGHGGDDIEDGLQSQLLSLSYESNLPTSLTYIILFSRGCSPWRPDADIGTITTLISKVALMPAALFSECAHNLMTFPM